MGAKNEKKKPAPVSLLPRSDLSALFSAPDLKDFYDTLRHIDAAAAAFEQKYKARMEKVINPRPGGLKTERKFILKDLTGSQLGAAVEEYEKIIGGIQQISTFARWRAALDETAAPWAEGIEVRLRHARKPLSFFELEINQMKESDLYKKVVDPRLAPYAAWLGKVRDRAPHQLALETEEYVRQKKVVAEDTWRRLYDKKVTDLRFTVGGVEYNAAETEHLINNASRPRVRHEAFDEYCRVFGENRQIFSLITNSLANIASMSDKWRKFERAEDGRHLANQINPDEADELSAAIHASYGRTAHRYYEWKAKKFGVASLHPADKNALPPEGKPAKISWKKARSLVLSTYEELSPEMGALAKRIFDEGAIDAEPRAGKKQGSFQLACPAQIPGEIHTRIFLNYTGTARDVKILTYEVGRAIHRHLSAAKGPLQAEPSLTLSGAAGIFGEMTIFRRLLDNEEDLLAKRALIATGVEDMLHIITRRNALFLFERRVHGERREKGEMLPERISRIWQETQKECFGPYVNLNTRGAENLWMSFAEFVRSPFSSYGEALGECVVNGLYNEYSKSSDKPGFMQKYTAALKAGGTKTHDDVLADFGLATSAPDFWKKSLSVVEKFVNDLLVLDTKIEMVLAKKAEFAEEGKKVTTKAANNNRSVARLRAAKAKTLAPGGKKK